MKKEIIYDDLLGKIPNKYVLAIVAGQRARELVNGQEPLVKGTSKDTIFKKALMEVLEDKITVSKEEEE